MDTTEMIDVTVAMVKATREIIESDGTMHADCRNGTPAEFFLDVPAPNTLTIRRGSHARGQEVFDTLASICRHECDKDNDHR